MRTVRLLVAVAVLTLIVPVFAQDAGTTLAWKFTEGKPFYQEMTTKTDQTMKVMGSDIKQSHSQTFYFSWTPVKKDGDNTVLKQKIEGVKMSLEIGGQPISYDSTNPPQTSSALGDFFKSLVGTEFTVTLDKNNKVVKIEGRDEFVKKLSAANPQMESLLKQILSDESLKQMADPTFAAIPNAPKKKGDTWEVKTRLDLGPIGSYENTYKYTYEGKDEKTKLDRIKVDTTLKYIEPADSAVGGLPFRIKKDPKNSLASKAAGGYILFDADKGRVEEVKMDTDVGGELVIDIGGQTTVIKLEQKQATTVKTVDTNPAAAPAKKP